jgi:crotonobetainyl-CoA:carnitine CoA-transferase CaiB-like acyl-CoA transferase
MNQVQWPSAPMPRSGPLRGIRVLDLSAFAVGPWAGALLAAMGADVVKVEPPYGDHIRNVRPTKRGEPTTYTVSNLGKRSVLLDLKDPDAKQAALQLAAVADVVVENTRAGAMARLGLHFEAVAEVNPRIVYCSSSSFGSEGPMAPVGSTDPQGQAFSGFVSINGADGGDPEFLRYSAAIDLSTSTYLLQACLVGLHWRNRNGRGCHVTTSQFEGALAIQITASAGYLATGQVPTPMGTGNPAFAPSGAFQCRDGRYLAVSAPSQDAWVELCAAIDRRELMADERYATNSDRVRARLDLVDELSSAFAAKDLAWWRWTLGRTKVPHGEYAVLDDVVSGLSGAPVARFVTAVEHPSGGSIKVGNPPWTFSRTPATFRVAPKPGQHHEEFFMDAHPEPLPAAGSAHE